MWAEPVTPKSFLRLCSIISWSTVSNAAVRSNINKARQLFDHLKRARCHYERKPTSLQIRNFKQGPQFWYSLYTVDPVKMGDISRSIHFFSPLIIITPLIIAIIFTGWMIFTEELHYYVRTQSLSSITSTSFNESGKTNHELNYDFIATLNDS